MSAVSGCHNRVLSRWSRKQCNLNPRLKMRSQIASPPVVTLAYSGQRNAVVRRWQRTASPAFRYGINPRGQLLVLRPCLKLVLRSVTCLRSVSASLSTAAPAVLCSFASSKCWLGRLSAFRHLIFPQSTAPLILDSAYGAMRSRGISGIITSGTENAFHTVNQNLGSMNLLHTVTQKLAQ
jgi:hypothetical protein